MTDTLETPPAQVQTPAPPDPADVVKSADGRTIKGPDKAMLKALGMSSATAKRYLAQGRSQSYLNTKIVAQVSLVTQASNTEELLRAQHTANKIAKDPAIDARSRAACIAAVGQCGMALARASEVSISIARQLDDPEGEGEKPVIKPTQNNFYGFPPVIESRRRKPESTAKAGNNRIVDVPAQASPD